MQDRATSVRKRVIAISEAVIRADLDHANAIALCRGILARAGDTEESIQVRTGLVTSLSLSLAF